MEVVLTKLDWSRASERSLDPARYQRREDFLTPDQPTKSKPKKRKAPKSPSPAQLRKQAAHNERMKAIQEEKKRKRAAAKALEASRQAENAAAKAERRAHAKQQQKAAAEKKRLKEAERKAKAEARRAAFEEYQKTPEYAAKLAREAAKMAAKKKSHLQFWIEQETGLNADRESLREQWRYRLLKRPTSQE